MGIENIPKIGKVYKFLKAAESLAKQGVKESDILNAAKRELGEVSDLLKLQIRKFYKKTDAPSIKNPDKQPGDVVTLVPKDKRYAKMEDTSSQASGIMERIEGAANRIKEIMKERDAMYKPKQGLDLAEGLTRTIARKILSKKNIEIPKGSDPIDVFSNIFGESINDINNLAEELIEIDRRGGGSKNIDDMIEMDGLFDIEIPKNPQRGLTDEEMLKLKKEVDEEKMLDEFDPTDRTENSMGGFNRMGFADGPEDPKKKKGIMKVIKKIPKVGKVVKGAENIIQFIKTLEPIEAMKEVNKVIAKDGPYKNVSDKDTDKIFKDTQDHIFERDVPADEFAVRFDDEVDIEKGLNDLDEFNVTKEASQVKKILDDVDEAYGMAPKMAERFELKQKYPGIDDDLLTAIIDDPDPNNKAQVLGTLEQLMELQRQGKSPEEAVDIIKQTMFTGRKDNAQGGLNYLMGM